MAVVGAGALGTSSSELLARAGVGRLRILDRDIVEESNLGRQALFTAEDARLGRPKAVALAEHLRAFNPEIEIEPRVVHLDHRNVHRCLDDVDLVLDGCDNFETRYLLNDHSVARGRPWIYGACVGARGLTAVILPGVTPCLRCLFPDPPPAGSTETCDQAGIIGPAATLIASLQAAEALKILVGDLEAVRRTLLSVELWPFRLVEVGGPSPEPVAGCPACGQREFPFLEGRSRSEQTVFCGRDSVQILPAGDRGGVDLQELEKRLAPTLTCRRNAFALRVELEAHALTVFDDGRALVSGTSDPALARALYDRYVGS